MAIEYCIDNTMNEYRRDPVALVKNMRCYALELRGASEEKHSDGASPGRLKGA